MRFSRKIPTFVFGLSIGLLVGIGFFVFKINDLFNKMKDSTKSQITVVEQQVKTEDKADEEKRKNKERFKINFGKSDKVNYSEVDSLIRDNSEVNVATEELLSVKNVKIIHIDPAGNQSDSLASDIAGVKENTSDLYFIEFWKTPLNSKGYRFSKNKVLLYGFLDYNNVSLYELDNSYYIKSSDQVYKLFYGADFRSLERVIDSGLLAKIN
ncbi:MAG: hypothetical protein JNJ40_07315 [Bacteroidia bacterium]|nr:hypothetical protein [Bacteroidia bacterium]